MTVDHQHSGSGLNDTCGGGAALARALVGMVWYRLSGLVVAASVAWAQPSGERAALAEARHLTEATRALYHAWKFSEAELFYRRALTIWEQALGPARAER